MKIREQRIFKILLGPMILCGLLLALYALFRNHRGILLQFIASTTAIPSDNPLAWKISSTVLVHLERQIVLLLGLLVLFLLWQKRKIRKCLMAILIVSITFIDLYSAHTSYQLLMETRVVQQRPKMLDLLEDFPSFRVFFTSPEAPFHPDIVQFPKARSPEEHVTFAFETLRPGMGIFWGVNYMQEVDALLRQPYELFLRVAPNLSPEKLYHLLGTLNVKYLISLQELPRGLITLIHHFPEYPAWIYRVDRVVPRAYIVPKAIYEKDPKKAIEMLAGSIDPLKEVIVDEIVELPAKGSFTGETKVLSYDNRSVSLRASLNRPGILVLSDSFYPGWKVYVDGVERKIIRANYFLRGVFLPPGEHQVVFRYQPTSFLYGTIISLSTA
ncbi:MAG: YfhO family protein, partial [Candidatus Binatota bacterium]